MVPYLCYYYNILQAARKGNRPTPAPTKSSVFFLTAAAMIGSNDLGEFVLSRGLLRVLFFFWKMVLGRSLGAISV